MIYHILFPSLISFLLTPLIIKTWQKMSPVAIHSKYDARGMKELRARNNWIDMLFTLFMFVGLMLPMALYYYNIGPQNGWPVGLGFGLMVILPTLVVSIITLPKGTERFNEFWRYYELKWGVGIKSVRGFYILMAVVGLISLFMIFINL